MKLLYVFLAFLLLATTSWAAHTFNADSTIVTITSFPETINQTDHRAGVHANDWITVKLASHIMNGTSTRPLTFGSGAHHWIIDLSGADGIPRTSDDDTLYWGADTANGTRCVSTGVGSHDMKFRGGVYWHNPTGLTGHETSLPANYTSYHSNRGIHVSDGGYSVTFDSTTVRVIGSWTGASGYEGAYSVRLTGSGYNFTFNNSKIINRLLAYRDRQLAPGRAINFEKFTGAPITWSDSNSYHVRIVGGQIENSLKGLYTEESSWGHFDSARIQIYACSLKADEVEMYNVGSYASTTNSYSIHGRYWGRGSYIRKCYFSSGTEYQGGRPIMLEHWNGSVNWPIYIDSNRFDRVHEGVDRVYASVSTSLAIKVRQPAVNTVDGRGFLRIENNSITVLADTCTISTNYGTGYSPKATAIAYEWWNGEVAERFYYDSIINNVCSVLVNPANGNPGSSYPWRMTGINFDDRQGRDTTTGVRGNTFYTEQYGMAFGVYDGPVNHAIVANNTFHIDTLIHPNLFTPSQIGTWRWESNNGSRERMYDNVFLGAARDTQFRYGAASNGMSGRLFRTVNVYVKGSVNNQPVTNATVTLTNAYGQIAYTAFTNGYGHATGVVEYRFDTSGTGDSVGFNPFSIGVVKGAASLTHSKVVNADDSGGVDTVTLSGVIGDGVWFNSDNVERHIQTMALPSPYTYVFGLPAPKRQVIPLHNNNSVIVFTSSVGRTYAPYDLTRYQNGVMTDHYVIPSVATVNSYLEASFAVNDGDTILWCINNAASTGMGIKIARIDASTVPMTLIDTQNIRTGALATYGAIGVPAYLGGDTFIIETRRSGTVGSDTAQVQYLRSNDNGATWSAPAKLNAWSGQSIRTEVESWGPGIAAFGGLIASGTEVRSGLYNGSTWTMDNPSFTTMRPDREHAFIMTPDSVRHFLIADTSATSCVIHAWKKVGAAAWVYDTLYNAGIAVAQTAAIPTSRAMQVALVYTTSSSTLRAYYTELSSPTDPYSKVLYSRKWSSGLQAWSGKIRVSLDDSVQHVRQSTSVPSVHGDRSYVAYDSYVNGQWYWYLSTVLGTGAIDTPATPLARVSYLAADSVANNFSGNVDSVGITTTTGTGIGDSVIIAWSTTSYPDSNVATKTSFAFTPQTTTANYITVTMTEPDTLLVSTWVKSNVGAWSGRTTTSRPFAAAAPAGSFNDVGWTPIYLETFDTAFTLSDGQTFGTNNWLKAELGRGGTITSSGGYLTLNTPDFWKTALIRSTGDLPAEYKIRVKVGLVNLDLTNYQFPADTAGSPVPFNSHSGYLENGTYFLTITDSACDGDICGETWWHEHRKAVIDVDNHYTTLTPPPLIENHPVYMVYMNSAVTNAQTQASELLRTWTGTAWDLTSWNWNTAYTYDTTQWYYAEFEKRNGQFILRFYDGNKNIIEETSPVALSLIRWMSAQHEYMYIGEPHTDDYEGNSAVDEIQLLIPQGQALASNDSLRINTVTGPTGVGDSVIITYSKTGYPDSNAVDRIAHGFVANRVYMDTVIVDGVEPYTVYASSWILYGTTWSSRTQTARTFATTTLAGLSFTAVDSIRNDFNGTNNDSARFRVLTYSGAGDSVVFAWSLSGYPDSSAVLRAAKPFVASSTIIDTVIVAGTETYTLYASAWVKQGASWSIRQTGYKTFTAPTVVTNRLIRRNSTSSKGNVIWR